MTIKELYRVNPLRFILATISYVLIPLSAIGQSYLLMYEVTALSNRNLKLWLWLTAGELLILLVTNLTQSSSNYLATKQIQNYNHQVRANTIKHYYFDGQDHTVAAMQNRLTTDLKNTNENYLLNFFRSVQMACYILFAVIVLLLIHWSLLLVTLVLVGISIYLPQLIAKPIQAAFSKISDSNKKYLDVAEKWLNGLNTLQRYMAGGHLFKVMDEAAQEVQESKVQQTRINQRLAVMNGLVSSLLMLALFAFTAVLIANKLVVFGTITTVGNLQFYMATGLQYLGNYRGQIKSTKPLNAKIAEDSNAIEQQKENELGTAVAFSGKNLSVAFPNGEKIAFPDFSVKAGEKILLTGDSGTGKSTLFKLILGELKPATGTITYFDKDNNKINPNLAKIGYIAQTPRLFPVTIADNVTMFDSKLNQKVDQVLSEVDLTDDVKKFKNGDQQKVDLDHLNVSGGQRQKIVLAQAKIHDSDIILIDEGTSAIDQKATIEILKKLMQSKATIVFIAHNFSEEMHQMFNREIHLG